MKIIDNISTNFKTTKEIYDLYKENLLIIDNSFQRRYVWDEKQQIQLIETILLGYDIPELYFWQFETNPETGEAKYSVVDGQQRIGSIIDFINNKIQLKKTKLLDKETNFTNKYFDELTPEEKIDFWNYKFTIKTISKQIDIEEIKTLFLRLNISNKCLNPQELRNAQFNGKFLELAEELSNLEFWDNYKIFSNNEIRRMSDIEFVSNLLMFLRLGIKVQSSQKAMNEIYDKYNNQYYEQTDDKKHFIEIINIINGLFEYNKDNLEVFKKQTHLYTLFVTFYALKREYIINNDIYEKVKLFYDTYKQNPSTNQLVEDYYNSSQDAVKSQNNRVTRFRSLYNFITSTEKTTN